MTAPLIPTPSSSSSLTFSPSPFKSSLPSTSRPSSVSQEELELDQDPFSRSLSISSSFGEDDDCGEDYGDELVAEEKINSDDGDKRFFVGLGAASVRGREQGERGGYLKPANNRHRRALTNPTPLSTPVPPADTSSPLSLLLAIACVRLVNTRLSDLGAVRRFMRGVLVRTRSRAWHVGCAVVLVERLKVAFGRALDVEKGTFGVECRLFCVALMLSHKMLEDLCPVSRYWCDACGISCDQMLSMEMEFLHGISFNLVIQPSELLRTLKSLAAIVATLASDSSALAAIGVSRTEANACLEATATAVQIYNGVT